MTNSRAPHAGLGKIAEASGQNALELWEQIADTMSEAVLVLGPDRRVIYGNRQARALMTVSPEEAVGKRCTEVVSCPQCECMCRLFEEGRVQDLEVVLYAPGEGTARVYRKNARLLRAKDGSVIGGVETLADVSSEVSERTEKLRRAEMLFREKRRSDALLRSMEEGVLSLDGSMRVTDFSERMEQMTGYAAREMLGQDFRRLFDVSRAAPACSTRPSQGPSAATLLTKNGQRKRVSVVVLPMRYGRDELLAVIRPAGEEEEPVSRIEREHAFHGMISRSSEMRRVFDAIRSTADTDARILVQGESGTGKELVCRALHALSGRCAEPFFPVNCATFTGSLLLSELFGHERGAFTGATGLTRGKLELAGRGTLLLDEVAEIPLEHQAMLLRVLEDGRFQRLGSDRHIRMDARVVAATNRDLRAAVAEGAFRRDLFYRLAVVPIEVPPLRHRGDDIALLVDYFLLKAARDGEGPPKTLSPSALAALEAYPWPGNVRELRNLVDYLGFVSADQITPEHLPTYVLRRDEGSDTDRAQASRDPAAPAMDEERASILRALETARWKRQAAAELLGIDRTTLWRRMRKLGIESR